MNAAHLHLLVNHLPVIGTLFAILLLAGALVRRNTELARASLALFVVAAITGLAAYFTGEPAEDVVERIPGITKAAIHSHEEAAELATILLGSFGVFALGALIYFRKRTAQIPRGFVVFALLLSLIPAAAMAWTANQGGEIRHAEIRSGNTPALAAPASSLATPRNEASARTLPERESH